MKILLDECLPLDLRHHFDQHDAHTAQWAGFKGKKNSELIRCAVEAGYGVLITVDQGIRRHWTTGCENIVLLRSRTNQLEDLVPLIASIRDKLRTIRPGEFVAIP